jgi:DNA polymerase III subunit epsilon
MRRSTGATEAPLPDGGPPPGPATPLDRLRLLAVDVETTGLDPAGDSLLAVGLVPVDGGRVDLHGARRLLVRHEGDPGPGVALHGLTHDLLATGTPLGGVVEEVLAALSGRVLLAHHAVLETGFLDAACRRELGRPLRVPVVDTLVLQRRLQLLAGHSDAPPGSLRLWAARRRFGLPEVPAHDALGDAVACAELYLAQVAELAAEGRARTLRDVAAPVSGGWRSGLLRRWRSSPRRR